MSSQRSTLKSYSLCSVCMFLLPMRSLLKKDQFTEVCFSQRTMIRSSIASLTSSSLKRWKPCTFCFNSYTTRTTAKTQFSRLRLVSDQATSFNSYSPTLRSTFRRIQLCKPLKRTTPTSQTPWSKCSKYYPSSALTRPTTSPSTLNLLTYSSISSSLFSAPRTKKRICSSNSLDNSWPSLSTLVRSRPPGFLKQQPPNY